MTSICTEISFKSKYTHKKHPVIQFKLYSYYLQLAIVAAAVAWARDLLHALRYVLCRVYTYICMYVVNNIVELLIIMQCCMLVYKSLVYTYLHIYIE